MEVAYQTANLLLIIFSIPGIILTRIFLPNRFWIAIVFSVVSFPFGHFYIKGGFTYFLLVTLMVALLSLFTLDIKILVVFGCCLSLILMIIRFKFDSIRTVEQGS